MLWWDSYRAVYGAELRAAALGFAEHGWPVVPGEFRTGRMIPAFSESPEGGADRSADPTQVMTWWDRRPFGILLATGSVLNVIEAPAEIGRAVCGALRTRGELVPVAATSTGRWWIPVAAGSEPPWAGAADDADGPEKAAGVRLISDGALVPAPPSECTHGFVHWRVSPSACGWRLPSARHLGELVMAAVTDYRWPARSREGRGTQRPAAVPIGVRS